MWNIKNYENATFAEVLPFILGDGTEERPNSIIEHFENIYGFKFTIKDIFSTKFDESLAIFRRCEIPSLLAEFRPNTPYLHVSELPALRGFMIAQMGDFVDKSPFSAQNEDAKKCVRSLIGKNFSMVSFDSDMEKI